jgi:hypothetical protein
MIEALDVRRRISEDLALLRSLTRALIAVAQAADERQRPIIRDVLCQLCSEVERYFAFEQEVVMPILRDVDAWGPVRVERLCREHDEQRSVLVALAENADDSAHRVQDLADELVWFFERFEQEIAEEEDELLSAEAIGAEPRVDQVDG